MYRFILAATTGRRMAATGLAAVALSAAAACSDSTTAPASPNARQVAGPNALTVGGGPIPQLATFVSVHIIDVKSNLVTEKATVRFRWSQPNDSLILQDNSEKDLDPTVGIVKIAAPKAGGYEACVRGSTAHFSAAAGDPSYPVCNSKLWLSFNFDVGNVYMRGKPQLTVRLTDGYNTLLPGASVTFYNMTNWMVNVADGQAPWDEPPVNDGKITVTVPWPDKYGFYETKAPTGQWEFLGPSYQMVWLAWEQKYVGTIPHQQYTK